MALLATTPLNNHLLTLDWISKPVKAMRPREFASSSFRQSLAGNPVHIPNLNLVAGIKGTG